MHVNSVTTRVRQKQTFLDKVNQLVSWTVVGKFINHKMSKNCNAVGRPAYSAVLKMFKVLLLQFWYNLSDRETAAALFDRISFRKF